MSDSKNSKDSGEDKKLLSALHAKVMEDISFQEAVHIVSSVVMGKIVDEVSEMSEDQKSETYKDLGLN
jgi:division protein CdvB (Snf7/Vps24/ESCRT-III family)